MSRALPRLFVVVIAVIVIRAASMQLVLVSPELKLLLVVIIVGVLLTLIIGTRELVESVEYFQNKWRTARPRLVAFRRSRPWMSLVVFVITGSVLGAGIGVAAWAAVFQGVGEAARVDSEPPKQVTNTLDDVKDALSSVQDTDYRDVVAEVVHTLEPRAQITVGGAILSADGARTVDIQVRSVGTPQRFTAIDVIDRSNRKPVAVDAVDAAESKRRDIGADPMLISSNTGFDPLAIRKAKRTGIGLISVLKQGDDRLRGVIEEEIYLRKVVVSEVTVRFDGPPVKNRPKINRPDDLRYREDTVSDWLALRMVQACTGIATSGPLTLSYRLKQRTNFRAPGGRQFPATKISISFHANVEWRSQIVQLDATNAIYDYVRGRVRPVGSQGSYTLRDVSFDLATPLPEPPPTEAWTAGLKPGEMTIGLAYVSGRGVPTKIIPQSKAITDLIQPEDLVDLPVLFAKTPQ